MRAKYINLKSAADRRLELEKNIRSIQPNPWTIERFDAIDINHIKTINLPGKIRPSEKACFLSHVSVLEEMRSKNPKEPFIVWEDDVVIGEISHIAISQFLKQIHPNQWDILYTDLIIPDLKSMLDLFILRKKLKSQNQIEIIDLTNHIFAGATSYLINPDSLDKILKPLKDLQSINEPFDLILRRLIHQKAIRGHALFPFATTVSNNSLNSQIQPDSTIGTDLAWTIFRKLMWAEASPEDLYVLSNRLSSLHPDPESSIMGMIAASILSPHFKPK
jgi:GR25 family glycosyltransferase involved in LPS biosynthesis